MDVKKILLEQRNLNLKNYGFDIDFNSVNRGQNNTEFKYIIRNQDFVIYIYRDTKDEVDTLSQIITYLDSTPHKITLAEAKAYEDCIDRLRFLMSNDKYVQDVRSYMQDKLGNAKNVDLEKELADLGIENINSLHCTNFLGLEDAKSKLAELYMSLAWLKQTAEQQGLNYDTAIFAAKNGLQKI